MGALALAVEAPAHRQLEEVEAGEERPLQVDEVPGEEGPWRKLALILALDGNAAESKSDSKKRYRAQKQTAELQGGIKPLLRVLRSLSVSFCAK